MIFYILQEYQDFLLRNHKIINYSEKLISRYSKILILINNLLISKCYNFEFLSYFIKGLKLYNIVDTLRL